METVQLENSSPPHMYEAVGRVKAGDQEYKDHLRLHENVAYSCATK
jgi:hypothetical protein